MATAQLAVTIAALTAGIVCFLLYIYATIAAVRARAAALQSGALARSDDTGMQPRTISVDDLSKLVEALGKLADSLSRASPALTSLIGALLFFGIAALSSGALRS
jgi:hypothetical protein